VWENYGIKIDGIKLDNLRFANDIVLIAGSNEELQRMEAEQLEECKKGGFEAII